MAQGVCVLSSGVVCRVPFRTTRCVRNWSKHASTGVNGPQVGLEWVLHGPEKGLQTWVYGLV